MDHSKDEEVKKLFETVKNEQKGQLDILVNNAYAGVNMIMENMGKSFWESNPFEVWDCINGVGLRNHYCCTAIASRYYLSNLWLIDYISVLIEGMCDLHLTK